MVNTNSSSEFVKHYRSIPPDFTADEEAGSARNSGLYVRIGLGVFSAILFIALFGFIVSKCNNTSIHYFSFDFWNESITCVREWGLAGGFKQ